MNGKKEKLYRVAWWHKNRPERPFISGRNLPKDYAEKVAAEANKMWPELHHWVEEVTDDE